MLLILNLYASQYLGEKGWFQVNRMSGLNRPIGHRLKRHSPARILKQNLRILVGRAAAGAG
jgi:hypothetical protein